MKSLTTIFDVGKTNKKVFLFDEERNPVYEEILQLTETRDEDGYPCEDLNTLTDWVLDTWQSMSTNRNYKIKNVNFSAYGASLIHLDKDDRPLTPLYNYLKPLSDEISAELYEQYGGVDEFSRRTASPALGMLNSGLQLWWIKTKKPELFEQIEKTLHLPQYLSFLISGKKFNDLTSIGCHTGLWDFDNRTYHPWLKDNDVNHILPDVTNHSGRSMFHAGKLIKHGIGIHDSSSALIPYLRSNNEPFILISSGTWNIALNPFNTDPLTPDQLKNDCLCYMRYDGIPAKASRLFFGNEHDFQVGRMTEHFRKDGAYWKSISYDSALVSDRSNFKPMTMETTKGHLRGDGEWNLNSFPSIEAAYHDLMYGLVELQIAAIELIQKEEPIKLIYIDGGFASNHLFIEILRTKMPGYDIVPSQMANASALGAAIALD